MNCPRKIKNAENRGLVGHTLTVQVPPPALLKKSRKYGKSLENKGFQGIFLLQKY